MCTATWLMNPDGYELFCNRDESKTRKPALPPVVQQRAGVKYIAPTDGDAGGSWIAVNEFGLSLCLLNYYPEAGVAALLRSAESRQHPDDPRFTEARLQRQISRGLLLISLIDSHSSAVASKRVNKTSLESYRPFLLLVLEPGKPVVQHAWDGRALSSMEAQLPVTTSSFDTTNVVAARRAKFAELQGEAYHMSGDERGNAYSVCMTRDDAQTVSFSHVIVSASEIEFRYRARTGDTFGDPVIVREAVHA